MNGAGRDGTEREGETATARLDGNPAAARASADSEQLATARLDEGSEAQRPDTVSGAELAVGTVIGGRYELLRRVAGGSMGVVYKALDRQRTLETHEPAWVAVKVLTPRLDQHGPALRALQREAETGLLLDHPNVVSFHGLGRDGNRFYIVMEWLPGCSLADWLDRRPGEPMPTDYALHIVRSIGAALAHAHERGVVHADVKPGNVMLLPDGGVQLCDFGIARLDRVLATGTGTFDPGVLKAATPAYSSPEVLKGETPTIRDDIYSLACVAYRMLSGRRVFGNRDALEAEAAGECPGRIEGLGEARWQALEAALAFSRYERPPDVRTFLRTFAAGRAGRRRRILLMLAVLLLGAAAVIVPLAAI
ncbi:serine/threonine-protein kinase [Lentisalinibacter salinarum]|uniref:serine/threonine-protein kinase n=1 Tax=Lentisalinibacter salinarum TaxID=2992239 RepID=UPI003863EF75